MATNYEKISNFTIEELSKWLDKYGEYEHSPWCKWFDATFCKKCEPIKGQIDGGDREVDFAYCELNTKCKYFPEEEEFPSDTNLIRTWLSTEADPTDYSFLKKKEG